MAIVFNNLSAGGSSSNILDIGNGNDYRSTIYDLLMLYKNGEITNGTYILSYKWLASITSTSSATAINVDIYGLMPLEDVDYSNANNSTKRYNCMQEISNDFTSDELVINETKYYYTKEEIDELVASAGGSELYLHTIQLGSKLFDTIINNDSTPFTVSTYGALLKEGGYTSQTKGKPVNNISVIYPENATSTSFRILTQGTAYYYNATNVMCYYTYLTITINDDFTVTKKIGNETSGLSVTDKVTKL